MTIAVVNDSGDLRAYIATLSPGLVNWLYCSSDDGFPDATAALVWQAPDEWLQQLKMPALVAETNRTLQQMGCSHQLFGRFCGWPTLLQRKTWEVATAKDETDWLPALAAALEITTTRVADVPGLVAPRLLATIINEACYALEAGICTTSDLDIAMQLGTNYPIGPWAWLQKIGPAKVHQLLSVLAVSESRYQPHVFIQPKVS